jgi:hypothetical protein
MKNLLLTLSLALGFAMSTQAQTTLQGAESFSVQLPAGFQRTVGANDLASVQWEHADEELYGYIIFENIDELKLGDITPDIKTYAALALNDFSELKNFKLIDTKSYKTDEGKETLAQVFSYYNDELETTIILQVNVYTTKNFIYKMISFGDEATFNKSKDRIDFISKR